MLRIIYQRRAFRFCPVFGKRFLLSFLINIFIYLFMAALGLWFLFIYLFIYWLCWVFIAACGLSLVVASGGAQASLVVEHGL